MIDDPIRRALAPRGARDRLEQRIREVQFAARDALLAHEAGELGEEAAALAQLRAEEELVWLLGELVAAPSPELEELRRQVAEIKRKRERRDG